MKVICLCVAVATVSFGTLAASLSGVWPFLVGVAVSGVVSYWVGGVWDRVWDECSQWLAGWGVR